MEIESGQVLSHYHLIEKIGQGGMGVVWKARDSILGREVAIKVLPAELALDEQRRRMFLEEARLASSVSDAHIVQVFELGREGDLDFIVMEYVEGEPLSKSLTGRPLPSDRVASLGEQVARALARAHRKQLLHRDIKPGNILVTPEGEVKLVDFGLAGLFQPGPSTINQQRTTQPIAETTGSWADLGGVRVFGTLPYMSPEQVRGEKLDPRSDIFSLGTVLYEMTTGRRPFRGESAPQVAAEIQKARSRPPRELVPKVPMELDRIVVKSLAARPSERYQTMEDLAVDLRKLGRDLDSGSAPSYGELQAAAAPASRRRAMGWATVVVALAVVAIGAAWMTRASWQAGVDPHTILILPFEVRGQTDGAAYVGRAFAEAMAVNLAQAEGLKVLPVPEENELGGSGASDRLRAARAQNAGLVLAGSLTRNGTSLSADLNLTDAIENRLVWGTRMPGEEQALYSLANSIVMQVESELKVNPPRLYEDLNVPFGSAELLASSELAQARATKDMGQQLVTAEKLADRFPNEPFARLMLTSALQRRASARYPGEAEHREYEASLRELNRLDPNNPWADLMEGYLKTVAGKGDEAMVCFNRGLSRADLSPRLRAHYLNQRGQTLSWLGHHKAGIESFEEALRLTPLNIYSFDGLVWPLMKSGKISEGLELARKAYALEPNEFVTIYLMGEALWRAGRYEEALLFQKRACDLQGGMAGDFEGILSGNCVDYAEILMEIGKMEEAMPYLVKACRQGSGWCVPYAIALHKLGRAAEASTLVEGADPHADFNLFWDLANYHASAGDRAEAIRYLREMVDGGQLDLWIATDPMLQSLHGDPEFEAIIAEVKRRIES